MRYLELYNSYDFTIEKAEGVYIFDTDGNKYFDTFSGIGVLALGHSHPEVVHAISDKLHKYAHTSNYFLDQDTETVAELISDPGDKVFFVNSGTEATELALKIIKKKIGAGKILFFSNSFHGRSLGALSVNGFPGIRDQFKPLLPDTIEAEFNDIESLREAAANNPDIKAVFFEPLQGSGGVQPASEEFVAELNQLIDQNNWILAVDEVQAGLYRTAEKYSYQNFDLSPDLITVAKALGGGLPLGGVVMKGEMTGVLEPGDHGSTFAPNPLALRGARVVMEKLESMQDSIAERGEYFLKKLKELKSEKIKEVRGIGLMLGIELNEEIPDLRAKAQAEGILLNIVKGKVIRFLPALNITKDEIDQLLEKLKKII
ncbi:MULTISPECIES: aspartate aminotransferase family protein [Halanaerobium]|jgi:acetylornithine/N-succinyldiaminopimelate aminotransferase|uniref:Acetyldiaminopimelate aminotransferase apoenzyme n=1 Tax=Halanaerobium kushneri TaxID=56779 RepID=A0A1N6PFE2_9FIRM|nr:MULTISPECIES: aminotransferase class III-fold pyridoxal phosphate-dependent enzyme [Halanaerobium]RCW51344.1 acetyldiaminopimelate aminotransferase [Halanaerobium sp. ST460_2HS_T2]SIQ03034.1 acetyldiaminopimelate aminotransferase apoenzyme [Halanaerobium kushneri]